MMRRKPTDAELIAAGWKSPPRPPPTEGSLLWGLRETLRTEGPRSWTMFSPDADEVLRKLHEREPGLLCHKVTKRWGDMWRIANAATTPAG
jgi:putative SOS response-associated peptidase YedK